MSEQNSKLDTRSPIAAMQKRLHSWKFWTFGAMSLITYVLFFFQLFGNFLVLQSMIYVLSFFIFFHFFYLELRKLPITYILLLMLIVSLIEILFAGIPNIFLIASMLTINIGIVMLANYLQSESDDKNTWSSWAYFNVGGYIFTVFITLSYSFFVLGYYAKFPFTCQDLSNASSRVVTVFTNPVTRSMEKIRTDTNNFFNIKVKDIATIGSDISLNTEQSTYSKIIQTFNTYKKNLIDQTFKDNSTINLGICDYLLGQMNKIYDNPAFKASVILLMFFLLYGFIRIVFWVMTGIAFVIFKLLYGLKLYRIIKVLKEVEDLE